MNYLEPKNLVNIAKKRFMFGPWTRSDTNNTQRVCPIEIHNNGDFSNPLTARENMVNLINFLEEYEDNDVNVLLAAYMVIHDDVVTKFNANHWKISATYVQNYAFVLNKVSSQWPRMVRAVIKVLCNFPTRTDAPMFLMQWITRIIKYDDRNANTIERTVGALLKTDKIPIIAKCRIAGAVVCIRILQFVHAWPKHVTKAVAWVMSQVDSSTNWDIINGGDYLTVTVADRRMMFSLHTGTRKRTVLTTQFMTDVCKPSIVKDDVESLLAETKWLDPNSNATVEDVTEFLTKFTPHESSTIDQACNMWSYAMLLLKPMDGLNGVTCPVCMEGFDQEESDLMSFLDNPPIYLCDNLHPVHFRCAERMPAPATCVYRCRRSRVRIAAALDHSQYAARK